MKIILSAIAIGIFGVASASAQTMVAMSPSMNFQPQMLLMQDHPQRASQTPMAQEQDLLEHSTILYERGERPLWEFMQQTPKTPLGDIARAYKQDHANAPKAVLVWNN